MKLTTWFLTPRNKLSKPVAETSIPSPRSLIAHPRVGLLVGADVIRACMPDFDPADVHDQVWAVTGTVRKRQAQTFQDASMWTWREIAARYAAQLRSSTLARQIDALAKGA